MKRTYKYVLFISLWVGYFTSSTLEGQANLIPKIGWTVPSAPPVLDEYEIDSKNGILLGLEYRDSGKSIYFNPGVYFLYNKIDVNQLSLIDITEPKTHLLISESLWLKLNMGMAVNIIKNNKPFNLHLRNGISGGLLLKKPDFQHLQILNESYRQEFIEIHVGLGVDLRRVIINADYHLSLIRRISQSDYVENTFTLNIGYLL